MLALLDIAPNGAVTAYDRAHLLIYAELIDAADAGVNWRAGARPILGRDPATDPERVRRCWESHLVRARWIVGEGLGTAIEAFGDLALRREG